MQVNKARRTKRLKKASLFAPAKWKQYAEGDKPKNITEHIIYNVPLGAGVIKLNGMHKGAQIDSRKRVGAAEPPFGVYAVAKDGNSKKKDDVCRKKVDGKLAGSIKSALFAARGQINEDIAQGKP